MVFPDIFKACLCTWSLNPDPDPYHRLTVEGQAPAEDAKRQAEQRSALPATRRGRRPLRTAAASDAGSRACSARGRTRSATARCTAAGSGSGSLLAWSKDFPGVMARCTCASSASAWLCAECSSALTDLQHTDRIISG